MTIMHDIAYTLGDAAGWDRCTYHRDQYGEIDGVTTGRHSMYLTIADDDCLWQVGETDDDGYGDIMDSGHVPTDTAADTLASVWLAAIA